MRLKLVIILRFLFDLQRSPIITHKSDCLFLKSISDLFHPYPKTPAITLFAYIGHNLFSLYTLNET